ncbi:DNA-directed RNA polymerase subunit alpha [Patescibacteria group bacterium]|nr:DNA-directed RNA polymerase subunit alpha [Patescibacteria group bacterium]
MLSITPPQNITYSKLADNKSEVVIGPCYPGYGVTIGNSLRRVLLASLDGAAIVGFKIKGVDHEFSAIDNVKEDVVDIILNLKKVKLKIHEMPEEGDVKLTVKVSGLKKVTAGDIKKDSNVEIINSDQLIATLTDAKADFEMEIFARQGRGYETVEQRVKEKLEIGTIAIDSLYSPVVNVGFTIESTRVGEMTNYEKLIMLVETDGSLSIEEAVNRSTELLVEQFSELLDTKEEKKAPKKKKLEEKVEELPEEEAAGPGRPKKEDK